MTMWTPTKVAPLTQMWGAGKSASRIAAAIRDATSSSVIGKAHRLGLAGRPSPIIRDGEQPYPKKPRVQRLDHRMRRSSDERAALPKPVRPPVVALAARTRTVGACCWPTNDGRPWTFCAEPAVDDRPYCQAHCERAYQLKPLARL